MTAAFLPGLAPPAPATGLAATGYRREDRVFVLGEASLGRVAGWIDDGLRHLLYIHLDDGRAVAAPLEIVAPADHVALFTPRAPLRNHAGV